MSDAIPSLPKGGEVGPKETFSGPPIDPFVPPMLPPMGSGILIQDLTPPMQRTDTRSAEPVAITGEPPAIDGGVNAGELARLDSRMKKLERFFGKDSGNAVPMLEAENDDDEDADPPPKPPKPPKPPPALPPKLMDALRLISDALGLDIDELMDEAPPTKPPPKRTIRRMGEDRRASGNYRAMGESLAENERQKQAEREEGEPEPERPTLANGKTPAPRTRHNLSTGVKVKAYDDPKLTPEEEAKETDEQYQDRKDNAQKLVDVGLMAKSDFKRKYAKEVTLPPKAAAKDDDDADDAGGRGDAGGDRPKRSIRRMGESRRGSGRYRAMGESGQENDKQKQAELEAEQGKEKEKWHNADTVREIEWRRGGEGEGGSSVWSGRVWFGGSRVLTTNPSEWGATHVRVDLRTGECTQHDMIDEDDEGDFDLANYEYYSVMTRTEDEDNPGTYTYALNSYTCGDIRCRIT